MMKKMREDEDETKVVGKSDYGEAQVPAFLTSDTNNIQPRPPPPRFLQTSPQSLLFLLESRIPLAAGLGRFLRARFFLIICDFDISLPAPASRAKPAVFSTRCGLEPALPS
jgi:hypothetical protein